jgi:small subunit ribosomal protein S1
VAGTAVKGRVLERVKGGLAVDIGVRAFLPGSIADTRPLKNLDVLKGRELDFASWVSTRSAATSFRARRSSKRPPKRRRRTPPRRWPGRPVKGVVKNLTEYGAFVDPPAASTACCT